MSGHDVNAGLIPATFAELVTELEEGELAEIDPELDTASDQPIGQINGVFGAKLLALWELLHTAYYAFDEESAEGVLMDNLAALTGTYREPARAGTVKVNCTLVSGTPLPSTATVSRAGEPSNQWRIKEAFTAPSTGVHSLTFVSTVTGVRNAAAGELTVIDTPVSGWSLATNPTDATPGRDRESTEELRTRRRIELPAQGACNVPTTAAAVVQVDGVRSVVALENTSARVDANGLPPKSFKVIVWDGVEENASNADIFEAIYKNKPGGILSFGAIGGTRTDEFGNVHNLAFDRMTQVEITVTISIRIDSDTYAGDAALKASIVAYGDALKGGATVVTRAIIAKALSTVAGITDAPACDISCPGVTPGEANIPISVGSIAVFDTSRVTVVTL